jgi:SAM-dependent methyltransferase
MTEFDDISKEIQEYLLKKTIPRDKLINKNYKLPLSDAIFCAQDGYRNRIFFKSINAAIKKLKEKNVGKTGWNARSDLTVIDAGSGIGILGAYALLLGADKCFFLENNPYSLEYSKNLLKHFKLEKKSHFIECDATKFELPVKYDLLISETITSGFLEEDFISIINNLRRFGKKGSIIIPESFEITITQKDKSGNELNKDKIHMSSYSKMCSPDENINTLVANQITYTMKAKLFDSFTLESGECMSFLNERTREC